MHSSDSEYIPKSFSNSWLAQLRPPVTQAAPAEYLHQISTGFGLLSGFFGLFFHFPWSRRGDTIQLPTHCFFFGYVDGRFVDFSELGSPCQ